MILPSFSYLFIFIKDWRFFFKFACLNWIWGFEYWVNLNMSSSLSLSNGEGPCELRGIGRRREHDLPRRFATQKSLLELYAAAIWSGRREYHRSSFGFETREWSWCVVLWSCWREDATQTKQGLRRGRTPSGARETKQVLAILWFSGGFAKMT